MEILKTHGLELVIVLFFIIYFIWQIVKNGLRESAIKFIVQAESGMKSNSEKMDYCVEKLIAIIPLPFSLFITKNIVNDFIQTIFNQTKIALNYQRKEEK